MTLSARTRRGIGLVASLVLGCGAPTQKLSLRKGGSSTSAASDQQTLLDAAVHDLSFSLNEDGALKDQTLLGDASTRVLAAGGVVTVSAAPTLGDVTVAASTGAFSYLPHPDANGTDHFQFRVDTPDGASRTATATLLIAPVNDAPVAVTDVVSGEDGSTIQVDALANDIDVDGKATEQLVIDEVIVPDGAGTAELTGSKKSFVYKPPLGFGGKVLLHYRVVDQAGASAIGTVEATITRVNSTIAAVADHITTTKNVVAHANILANDSLLASATVTAITAVSPPLHGQVTIALDGSTVYTPDTGYVGADGFSYLVETSHGDKSAAVVSITVNAP